ncbi:MAG: cupin domain-containing protein [Chloroflexota bacterium]|nr:cupin domain-containing protein [Chloroflexota bacterium]
MRRASVLLSILVLVLIGVVVSGRAGSITLAQEGTPSPDEFAPPEGISFMPLGFGTAEQLPTTPADFILARFSLDPGAIFPIEASDPSVTLVVIESGTVTFQVEAPITITRAATIAAFATPGVDESAVPAPEEIAAGTEFTMEAGDSAVFPPSIAGEVRNDGQETAVALLAFVEPQGGEEGTPTP